MKGAFNHETKLCYHNPDTGSCFTCGLFVDEEEKTDFTLTGFAFYKKPHCEEGHDLWWQDNEGTDWYENRPTRKIECPFYEEREDHPGEYVKFASGDGGFRRVYLPKESEE